MIVKDPRVLIICEQFISGNAITALNLFSKWDKQSLYCISRYNDFFSNNFAESYLLGNYEIRYSFPFKYFCKSPQSKIYKYAEEFEANSLHFSKRASKHWFRLLMKLMKLLGFFDKRLRYDVSDNLLNWVKHVNPNYIYTPVGSIEMAHLVLDLIELFPNAKLIYHGYDEWNKNSSKTLSKRYLKEGEAILKKIIDVATTRIAISKKMADYYQSYYDKPFYSFCNPVEDISKLIVLKKNIITFIGYIGNHNLSSILILAKALTLLNETELELIIYSNIDIELEHQLQRIYPNTSVKGWVSHSDIPIILKGSRILYLPIGLEEHVVKFTKYSISTKLAEYLASTTPILYLGPQNIAMTDILQKYNAAAVVTENNTKIIADKIRSLLYDKKYIDSLAVHAYNLFTEKFEKNKVSSDFRQCILQ